MARKTKDTPHLRLRVEPALLARLEKSAAKNERTLTGEIVHRLAQSFDVEERMTAFRETWEKQIEDWRQISEQLRKQAEQSREEARTFAEQAQQEVAKLAAKQEELNRKFEKQVASATMVDILLGDDKSKSALLRAVALNIARMSSDQFRDAASRHELVERELSRSQKKEGAGQ